LAGGKSIKDASAFEGIIDGFKRQMESMAP